MTGRRAGSGHWQRRRRSLLPGPVERLRGHHERNLSSWHDANAESIAILFAVETLRAGTTTSGISSTRMVSRDASSCRSRCFQTIQYNVVPAPRSKALRAGCWLSWARKSVAGTVAAEKDFVDVHAPAQECHFRTEHSALTACGNDRRRYLCAPHL